MFFYINEINSLKKFYQSNGYVVIKSFFEKKKVLEIKKKILQKNIKYEKEFVYFENIRNKKRRLRRIEKISDYLKDVKKFVVSKKIEKIIKELTGRKQILFKDKLNFKYPGGKGYEAHVDGHFYWKDRFNKVKKGWSVYSNKFTNAVIPLEKSDKKNGCLYLSKKKNVQILGDNWKEITNSLYKFTPNIKQKDLKKFKFIPAPLNIGDILLFDWHCAHRSSNNFSKKSRMIFYATYCTNNKKIKNIRNKYYTDKKYSKNDKLIKSLQFK